MKSDELFGSAMALRYVAYVVHITILHRAIGTIPADQRRRQTSKERHSIIVCSDGRGI